MSALWPQMILISYRLPWPCCAVLPPSHPTWRPADAAEQGRRQLRALPLPAVASNPAASAAAAVHEGRGEVCVQQLSSVWVAVQAAVVGCAAQQLAALGQRHLNVLIPHRQLAVPQQSRPRVHCVCKHCAEGHALAPGVGGAAAGAGTAARAAAKGG